MNEVLLSIVVPNYNNGKYIVECLNSVITSCSDEFEVIVVDDGSVDDSLEILKQLDDCRIRVITQKNQGVSVARNTGIDNSKGKYIIFCDSDDYYAENAISKILQVIKDNKENSELILFDYKIVSFAETVNLPFYTKSEIAFKNTEPQKELIKNLCLRDTSLNSPCNKIYQKSVIEEYNIRFPKGVKFGEDNIFNLNYAFVCKNISYLKEELYIYRYQISDFSSEKKSSDLNMLKDVVNYMQIKKAVIEKYLDKSGLDNIDKKSIMNETHIPSRLFYNVKLLLKSKKVTVTEIRKYVKNDNVLNGIIGASIFKCPNLIALIKTFLLKLLFI